MKKFFVILFTGASLSANAQCPTLVAHWPFTNGSTTEVLNSWTPNSSSLGSPYATAGRAGNPNTALKFTAGDNLVYTSATPMEQSSWTMTAIVRPDNFNSDHCQHNMIVQRGSDYSASHMALGYFDQQVDNDCWAFHPDQEVFFGAAAGICGFPITDWQGNYYPSGSTTPNVNPHINSGQWYCVTAVYDGEAGTMDLWVDGVHVVTGPWSDQYTLPSGEDLYIGSSNGVGGAFPYWLDAAVDDIKIYSGSFRNCASNPDKWVQNQCQDEIEDFNSYKSTSVGAFSKDASLVGVMPNPASNTVKVITPTDWKEGDITIFNAMGAMVQHYDANSSGTTTLDVSKLPGGIYMIDIEAKGHTAMKKFVKE